MKSYVYKMDSDGFEFFVKILVVGKYNFEIFDFQNLPYLFDLKFKNRINFWNLTQ